MSALEALHGETTSSGGEKSPHVIVVGNEKGGAGKTTTAMHIAAFLLSLGKHVGTLDLDVRQRSLTRYVENRMVWAGRRDISMPEHIALDAAVAETVKEVQRLDQENFVQAIGHLRANNDYVVVDCPGTDTYLSRLGHATADTLITPINDSFVDFDLLARVDADTLQISAPSIYSEMVWDCKKARAIADQGSIDWIVMRNRTSHVFAKNKERVENALKSLSARLGFRLVDGLADRVVFREMFPAGLTLLDLTEDEANTNLTMSHISARAEIWRMMESLELPELDI